MPYACFVYYRVKVTGTLETNIQISPGPPTDVTLKLSDGSSSYLMMVYIYSIDAHKMILAAVSQLSLRECSMVTLRRKMLRKWNYQRKTTKL